MFVFVIDKIFTNEYWLNDGQLPKGKGQALFQTLPGSHVLPELG